MPDRHLVGLLLISLVVAGVITGVTFKVREEKRIAILASRVPEAVQCQTKATLSHSLDFMVTRDLPDVIVRCFFLARPPESPYGTPWSQAGIAQKQVIQRLLGNWRPHSERNRTRSTSLRRTWGPSSP